MELKGGASWVCQSGTQGERGEADLRVGDLSDSGAVGVAAVFGRNRVEQGRGQEGGIKPYIATKHISFFIFIFTICCILEMPILALA